MMTMLRMLTGVFAAMLGAFGRRPPRRAETRPFEFASSPKVPLAQVRERRCAAPGGDEPPAAKLRRAAAWHGKAAIRCGEAGDEAGRREHSAHAKRYLDAFRRAEAGAPAVDAASVVDAISRERAAATSRTKVRVQCPGCLMREEYEIAMPPEQFLYVCQNHGCKWAEESRVWRWDRSFCDVVRGQSPSRDGALQELVCNAVDPDDKVWVTGKGKRVRPTDMTNGHLVNTIKYIRRKARSRMVAARRAAPYDEMHATDAPGMEHYIGRRLPAYEEMLRVADERGLKYE